MKVYCFPILFTKGELTGGAEVRNSRKIEQVKRVIWQMKSMKCLYLNLSKGGMVLKSTHISYLPFGYYISTGVTPCKSTGSYYIH